MPRISASPGLLSLHHARGRVTLRMTRLFLLSSDWLPALSFPCSMHDSSRNSDYSFQAWHSPPAREGRTSLRPLVSPPLLSLLCLPHLSSVLLLWPPSQLGFPTCFDETCALCWEISPKLPQPSDSQLLLEVLAHVLHSSGKSFGLCRECNQQPFPIPSSCFPDYSCLWVTSLLFSIQCW